MIIILLLITIQPGNIIIDNLEPGFLRVQYNFDCRKDRPVTRFILSRNRPRFQYRIIELDSIKSAGVKNRPRDQIIEIGAPINWAGQKLFPVTVFPYYLNKNFKYYIKSLEITFNYSEVKELNIAPSLHSSFKYLILNPLENQDPTPQGFLIITPNTFYNAVQELARWKEQKGWKVTIATLSETGGSANEIKNYIANAYHNWSPPPEYVILIGDKDSLPPAANATPVSTTDYPYSLIDGDDYFAELLIGRLPAKNVNELNTMIAKILGYEKNPYLNEPSWFKRSLMVAANYPLDTMTTPIATKLWVREKLLEYGFNTVDTVFYPPVSGPTQIINSINQGVIFVNYRGGIADPDGWVYPNFHNTDIIGLSNGWKLPVVTSVTCWTGNFGFQTCFGEEWLGAGNPTTPKGAVAFFGASAATTSSRWNNCLDYGIYWAISKEDIQNLGPALYRGKLEVFLNFPNDTSWNSGVSFYFHTYNLLGDPSLAIWTDIPDSFLTSHPATIPIGKNSISMQIQNSSSQPIDSAMVCLFKENEVKEVEFTNSSGAVDFNFSTSTPGTLFITITKKNFKPYCGYCVLNNSEVYVGHYSHTIDDSWGNNNGEINPGETINLDVILKNYGNTSSANNVQAKLTIQDTSIIITDSIKFYGDIGPGATAGSSPYEFVVSTKTKNEHLIKFDLEISSSQGNWNSSIWCKAKAPEFKYQWHQVLDGGNGILEPGETADLITSIENIGGLIGTNISGILRSKNPGVMVIDSFGTFGDIPVGDSAVNGTDRFRVTASSSIAPGHPVNFLTVISGDNNFSDTINFQIVIGPLTQNIPLGPDDYGYFAYDNTDTQYPESPVYSWVEIDPELGGLGDTLSLLSDETKTVPLPFNFKFYGNQYQRISISSDGYIAMDSTWIADMYNWHILSAGGPPLLIAPFWDDLDPTATDSSGNVCYFYDSSNQRFIIEYSRIQHIHNPTNPTPAELQTFEIILLDPDYHPTITGDGEIIFQYKKITNDDVWHNYATVGIENSEHTIGLEYSYNNTYPPAAAPLVDGRAIKFTTDPPDTFPGISEGQTAKGYRKPELIVYPVPFTKRLNIIVSHPGQKIINIYNTTGNLVRTIISDRSRTVWYADDNKGRKLPGGVYFINLVNKNNRKFKKVILLK